MFVFFESFGAERKADLFAEDRALEGRHEDTEGAALQRSGFAATDTEERAAAALAWR